MRRLDGDAQTGLRATPSLAPDFVMVSENEIYYVDNEADVKLLDITTDTNNICWAFIEAAPGIKGYIKNQYLYPHSRSRARARK